jgi:anti-sigma-K factor RskA
MNLDDELETQACLYAIGAMEEAEARAFEEQMRDQPALRQYVADFQASADLMARALPPLAPPPEVKARLMASMAMEDTSKAPSPLPAPIPSARPGGAKSPAGLGGIVPWAAAAGLTAMAAWQWHEGREIRKERDAALQEASLWASNARQAADKNSELSLAIQRAESSMRDLAGERDQAVAKVRTIENESESLRKQVAQLQSQNDLSNARVAVLGSLIKKKPDARAASVWSSERQSGVLVVENLPALPPGRDYQLWVLDPTKGAPISAGVFQVDATGAARVAFTAVETVTEPAQFAVTEEQQGGVPSPTMEKLVLAGK